MKHIRTANIAILQEPLKSDFLLLIDDHLILFDFHALFRHYWVKMAVKADLQCEQSFQKLTIHQLHHRVNHNRIFETTGVEIIFQSSI